jgi:hypothetical protein
MLKRLLIGLLLLGLLCPSAHAVSTTVSQSANATATSVLTTELNSLANNAWTAASAVIDNTIGGTGNGAMICTVELLAVFAASPTAGGAITGWFLKTVDNSNYETTPTASIGQQRLPDFVIPVVTGQTTTRTSVTMRCPPYKFKVVVQNTATGQAMAASANTLKIMWVTPQGN